MLQVETPPRWTDDAPVKVMTVETPTHLVGWLPWLWTRVLFAGQPDATPWCWRSFALLFALSGVVLYSNLTFHLFEPDEGRYAQIPREMLERGEWIVPTLQREPYLDKPPLFYWLVMLAYATFGYHAWAARLVPALAMHATVLLTYTLGQRMIGGRAAFWGTLLLIVSPMFLPVGRLLLLDGLLTCWLTLAALAVYLATRESFQWRWWIMGAVACGLAMLTKGPVALVLVVPPLVLERWLRGQASISARRWLGFVGVVLTINVPWYVAICVRQPEFAGYFLFQHNVQRFAEPFDHIRPVWFYVPLVLAGLLPAMLFVKPLWRFLTSTEAAESNQRCPAMGYLLLAGGWCVAFYSMAGSKLPTYILPAFPALCLALGCFARMLMDHKVADPAAPSPLAPLPRWGEGRKALTPSSLAPFSRWAEGGRWFALAVGGMWGLQVIVAMFIVPMVALDRSPMNDEAAMRARCGDARVPVVCFPRHVDSVAFAVGRSDFRVYRSKELANLLTELDRHPRTVVLFGHRHSPDTLARHLPAHLRMIERRPMGLCESAIIVRSR